MAFRNSIFDCDFPCVDSKRDFAGTHLIVRDQLDGFPCRAADLNAFIGRTLEGTFTQLTTSRATCPL